jgi:hypothetical protein
LLAEQRRGWEPDDLSVLQERTPSEGPCSTAARRATWGPFLVRKAIELGMIIDTAIKGSHDHFS